MSKLYNWVLGGVSRISGEKSARADLKKLADADLKKLAGVEMENFGKKFLGWICFGLYILSEYEN